MNKTVRMVSLFTAVLILLLAALSTSNVQAARNPFMGAWESTDIDGSYQTLNIGGGPRGMFRFRYHDRGATVCGVEDGVILYAGYAHGWFEESVSNVLTASFDFTCLSRPVSTLGPFSVEYTYHPGTDTITDTTGVTWTRK